MLESCYSPSDIVDLLRSRYGLPAELHSCRPTLLCDSRLGAIDMPAVLGSRVLSLLTDEPSVPIVAHPRDTRWTFLLQVPRLLPRVRERRRRYLTAHGVGLRGRGQRVPLPVADTGPGWYWACEPTAGALRLPTRSRVLDAIDLAIDLLPATTPPALLTA